MRKIIITSFITLDGVIQGAGGPEEGFEKYGGWSAPFMDEALNAVVKKQMQPAADLLLGRKTFEVFASFFPENETFWPGINDATKHVASTTMEKSGWKNCVFLKNVEDIKKLKKAEGPDLKVHGSCDLIQTLLKHDLVDELWLKIVPIVLGTGNRLFGDGALAAAFKLTDSSAVPNGTIIANYKRAGEVKTGSM